jgi:superfamily II DNA or RNA helicase
MQRRVPESSKEELLELLLFQRANIVKDAELKYQALHSVLDELVPLKWTLIYCSPRQIDQVMEIINQRRVIAHRFTAIEGTEPDNRYGGLSEREFLLDKFAEGRYQVLVAMKCLDEGVDVPPARTAILMASSGNPREYIQRIGRVIRRFPKKEEATLYDLIVVPGFGRISTGLADMEWRIFQKELERYEEIAMTAVNNAEALRLVYDIKEGFREVMYE